MLAQRRLVARAFRFLLTAALICGLATPAPAARRTPGSRGASPRATRHPVLGAMVGPNAYQDYARAAAALVEPSRIISVYLQMQRSRGVLGGPASVVDYRKMDSLVQRNRKALEIARVALTREYRNPAPLKARPVTYLKRLILVELMVLKGQVLASKGDHAGAWSTYLDVVELGEQTARTETAPGRMVAAVIEALGLRYALAETDEVPGDTIRAARTRLGLLRVRSGYFSDMLQGEDHFLEVAINEGVELLRSGKWVPQRRPGWDLEDELFREMVRSALRLLGKEGLRKSYRAMVKRLSAEAAKPYALRNPAAFGHGPTAAARIANDSLLVVGMSLMAESCWCELELIRTYASLLVAQAALRSYYLDRGEYPEKLTDCVPDYLPYVPEDPYVGVVPLTYRRAGTSYLLYSLGPDGHDDGGAPLEDPVPVTMLGIASLVDSRGDVVVGWNSL